MEAQQQLNQEENSNNGGCGKIPTSSYLCRQSSTRWTPTTEQIKLLKDLYYNNGVRSPSADQIQSICVRLRRYGKIEGKNVFYWFQNHKARERQKKRLTPNNSTNISNNAPPQFHNNSSVIARNGGLHWKQDQEFSSAQTTKYPTINNPHPGIASSSSSSSGQMMGGFAYGAVTMENNFRDCSISGNVNHNFPWAGAAAGNYNPYGPPNPPPHTNFLGKISAVDEDHDYQYHDDDHDGAHEIETLPLFPMHNEDNHNQIDNRFGSFSNIKPSGSDGYYCTGGYRWANGGGNSGAASLELSLNSYAYGSCYSRN